MANSSITITFTEDLPLGAQLGIGIGFETNYPSPFPSFPSNYPFKWVNIRSNYNEVTLGTPTLIPGERAAINFVQAFNLDTSGFVVTRNINEVTITYITTFFGGYTTYAVFASPIMLLDIFNSVLVPYPNHPSINISISNVSNDIFTINSLVFEQAAVPCTHAKLKATTNVLSTKILSPIIVDPNTNNPFEFECLRGDTITLEIENTNGTKIIELIEVPSILNASNFNIVINNSPNGATVVVENTNTSGLILEYSLDNSTWQTSNIFSGLIPDNYTLYVRDNLGCSFTNGFNVSEFGIYTPFFYISKSNSFRFANRINWGDSENYKTDENTLSCEVDVPMAYKEIQQFQSADIITTQFKSNYQTNIAKVIKSDLSEVNIPVIKKTSNIGVKNKRDARKYNLGSGKTGIYFISGNIYDYDTNVISGTHALNGTLPLWGKSGEYFNISGVWYQIEETIYDENKNAYIIVIENTYTGTEVNVIVGSIFNIENYEVYEFTFDMNAYIDEKFRVKLENTDPHFPSITHLTELIWCKIKHKDVLEIRYKNSTNTDVFYETGIEHKIRIPFTSINGRVEENSEIHKTDTDAILLNADLFEVDEFTFEPVTKEIMHKLTQALSHEEVFINGVGYVKNGSFNIEGALGDTNLHIVVATMMKTGNVYNSQSGSSFGFSGDIEIPGIITTDSGFVQY